MNNETNHYNLIKFTLLVKLHIGENPRVLVSDKSAGKLPLHDIQSESQLIQLVLW